MATKIIYPALENYQRNWRGYRVDKNLKDDWLIRLNNLHLFNVINVCEGHFTCEDDTPQIILLAKHDFFDKLKNIFVEREWLLSIFDEFVASDTRWKFSHTHTIGVSNDPNSIMNNPDFRIKMSLVRNDPRESLILDNKTSEWFEASVNSIERIDEALYAKLE